MRNFRKYRQQNGHGEKGDTKNYFEKQNIGNIMNGNNTSINIYHFRIVKMFKVV